MIKSTLCLTIGLLLFFNAFSYPGQILKQFSTPGDFSTGLTFDGNHLWLADRKLDKLFQIDVNTGKIIQEIPSPAYWPMGLAFDGENLWCVDIKGGIPLAENYRGILYKVNSKDGTIIHQAELSCVKPTGLAYDGNYLWVADEALDKIIQISPQDGTTIKEFRSPAANPMGLCYDGEYLWVSDRGTDEIYMISPKTGTVLVTIDAPGSFAFGLTFDGEFLWNVDWQTKKIYKLTREDEETFMLSKPKSYKVRITHETTNFGSGNIKSLDVYFAIGDKRENQKIIGKTEFSENPNDYVTDNWGQNTAHFEYRNIKQGESKEIVMTNKLTLFDIRYFIFPDKVGGFDEIPADIKNKYLVDHEKYQINHPLIVNALQNAVGDETNMYWIARNIYDYLIDNMYYEMQGGWNTAPTVLERGNGSCSEYTFVYIAMCRAAGIPARYVGSVVVRGDDTSMDDVFHRWAEIYLPNYGWIPIDPSGGDQDWPKSQADYFGHLNNRFYITTQSGGGSNLLEWTYNTNEFYKTDPKTFVVVEYFADWEPIDE
jgi:transglutaminase-like putative cysteine protease/DNA-binding beta-propeller fold protein YncE